MARVRKIPTKPPKSKRNYFIVDACFLAEKYLPIATVKGTVAKRRIHECKKWWKEIDRQIKQERARVYVPDLCIAESFKVLAKKYYQDKAFKHTSQYKHARDRLARDVTTPSKVLKSSRRYIGYHDVPASRDIIIAVDRFYELFIKSGNHVGIVDLIVVATAKYLTDFHDALRAQIHIVTFDKKLRDGSKKISELPNAYYPDQAVDRFDKVFD